MKVTNIAMWICPKCRETQEDQFDRCWRCAGETSSPEPQRDLVWLHPAISIAGIILFGGEVTRHGASPHAALAGTLIIAVVSWAFLACPARNHWLAKAATLLLLTVGSMLGMAGIGCWLLDLR